jgi:hypothetical protein
MLGTPRRRARKHTELVCYPRRVTQWVLIVPLLGTLSLALVGCNDGTDCCSITHRSYHLSGNAPPGNPTCSTMVLDFYEDHSDSCTSACMGTGQVPGKLILEQEVSSTSSWSADVSVSNAHEESQGVAIYAYCKGADDAGPSYRSCLGYTSVAAGNHDGISFSSGQCPQRE